MNRRNFISCIVVIFICLLPGIVQGEEDGQVQTSGHAAERVVQEWSLFLEGVNLEPDVPPTMTDRGLALPIRFVVEGVGGNIRWAPHTKEVNATVGNQKLYIHFTEAGLADTITLNGKGIGFQDYHQFTIISGRTMVTGNIVEKIIQKNVNLLKEIQLVNIHDGEEHDQLLEEFLNIINHADRHLDDVFRTHKKSTKQKLEISLQKYYAPEIAQMIIEHYYNQNIDGTYTALPTEKPIALLPLQQVEQIRLDSVVREETPWQILTVHRKPTLFNAYEVHSMYQFRQVNKQWIVVEIIHHLVDNGYKGIAHDGGITI